MPTIINDLAQASDWLKHEAPSLMSREQVVLTTGAVGTTMLTGTVLGMITASGKFVPHTIAAADGSEAPAAILLFNTPGTGGDVKAVVIARDALVAQQALVYGTDVNTAPERAAVNASLKALGILVREGA